MRDSSFSCDIQGWQPSKRIGIEKCVIAIGRTQLMMTAPNGKDKRGGADPLGFIDPAQLRLTADTEYHSHPPAANEDLRYNIRH